MNNMAQNESNPNPNPDKNGNFFNKNPLITFALFSIVVIILFKALDR
jgi:cell division protease FtsH